MSATQTARQINHSDSVEGREVAFKAMISGFARGMEEHLVDTPVTFLVDLSPVATEIDLQVLERVMQCLTNALVSLDSLTTIIVGSRTQNDKATIKLSGFLTGASTAPPKAISGNILGRLREAGIDIRLRVSEGRSVAYDIGLLY